MKIAPLCSQRIMGNSRRKPNARNDQVAIGCISTLWTGISFRIFPLGRKSSARYALNPNFFDVHLMCSQPEILLESFAKDGADQLTIHAELTDQARNLIWRIRNLERKVGLAVNPPTPLAAAEPYLDKIDTLLIMTVNPGFGGQSFMEECLPKIQQAWQWRQKRGLGFRIEVDGGIDAKTAVECSRMGADTFVSGTALFSKRDMKRAITKMREGVEQSRRR